MRLQVTGTCMTPALAEGDTVLLAPTSERSPRLGDVVLVRLPKGLRLHRLVFAPPLALKGARYRTQADRGARLRRAADGQFTAELEARGRWPSGTGSPAVTGPRLR